MIEDSFDVYGAPCLCSEKGRECNINKRSGSLSYKALFGGTGLLPDVQCMVNWAGQSIK